MPSVRVRIDKTLRTEIEAGAHRFIADEPASVGGEDSGPTPYDLVLGGLGACTAMTLRLYADRKEWPLQSVEVELSHHRQHVRDCEDCEEGEGPFIDRIDRVIHLRGDLDEGQRARLRAIAERCPVHRTLVQGPRISTTLG